MKAMKWMKACAWFETNVFGWIRNLFWKDVYLERVKLATYGTLSNWKILDKKSLNRKVGEIIE